MVVGGDCGTRQMAGARGAKMGRGVLIGQWPVPPEGWGTCSGFLLRLQLGCLVCSGFFLGLQLGCLVCSGFVLGLQLGCLVCSGFVLGLQLGCLVCSGFLLGLQLGCLVCSGFVLGLQLGCLVCSGFVLCNEIGLRRVILIKESQNFLKSEIWNAGRGDRDRRAPSAVASSSFGDFKSFFNRTDLDHFFISKRSRFARDSDRSRPVWVETALDQIESRIH